jgi:hypothetical protein
MIYADAEPHAATMQGQELRRSLRALRPAEATAASYARAGAVLAGGLGAITGLVIGLHVYAPTAWFAVLELGVPAAIAGGLLGFLSGAAAAALRRRKHHGAAD